MKKLLIVFLLYPWILFAEIREMSSFKELSSLVDEKTLVILDIDDTLLIPAQMLGCDEWFQLRFKKHKEQGFSHEEALDKSLAEWEAVRHLTKMEVVEPASLLVIEELQKREIQVMGLTTQGLALATRTTKQLREKNIDLNATSPFKEDFYVDYKGHGVLLRGGVFFTSGRPKGETFFLLCEKTGFFPKKMVFVNDKESHLRDLEEGALKRNIPFLGLRFSFSDQKKEAFSPEIAEFQFSHSSFAHLLSDEEAMRLLTQSNATAAK